MDVLLVRAGALGDLLLLRRAVHLLRRAGHTVRLLCPPPGEVLVAPDGSEVAARLPWEAPETARLLAGEPAGGPVGFAIEDAALVVAYTRSDPVVRLCRELARQLIVVDPAPPPEGPHAARWLADPLARFASGDGSPEPPNGWLGSPLPPRLSFTQEEHAQAERLAARLPRRFLAIHPGSGSSSKNWPAERFFAFAARHAEGAPWLLVLGPAESGLRWPRTPAAVLARELPPRGLGALLSRAGLFLGNDSGISHLAAAAGAPTLALFGPTDPALWSPDGCQVRCLRSRASGDLAAIPLDDVLAEADALRLTSAASAPPCG